MIRPATLDDLPDLVFLAEKMHGESRFRDRPFVEAKVAAMACSCIQSEHGLALVAELEGEVVGGFLGGVAEREWNHDLVAYDHGLFVSPDRRGGILAIRLLEQFAAWARSLGAAPGVGLTTGVNTEATAACSASPASSRSARYEAKP